MRQTDQERRVSNDVTVICLVRHGHATTRACLETLYANTSVPGRVVYVGIASRPALRDYLENFAAEHEGFTHLHFDRLISRQQARIEALRAIDTPYVVLLDNNMMCSPGWLEKLLAARTQT